MKQQRHTTGEIIRISREAAGGKDREAVRRQHNVSAASFSRWKKKFGGMELKDARKYRQLEKGERRTQLVARRGAPGHLRSDNGSEFVARTLQSLAGPAPRQDALHRTRQSLAERARRELPRLTARRVPGSGTHAECGRGPRGHRRRSTPLQRGAAPRRPRLPHPSPSLPRGPGYERQSCQRLTPRA